MRFSFVINLKRKKIATYKLIMSILAQAALPQKKCVLFLNCRIVVAIIPI